MNLKEWAIFEQAWQRRTTEEIPLEVLWAASWGVHHGLKKAQEITDDYATNAHLKAMHVQYDTARFLATAIYKESNWAKMRSKDEKKSEMELIYPEELFRKFVSGELKVTSRDEATVFASIKFDNGDEACYYGKQSCDEESESIP